MIDNLVQTQKYRSILGPDTKIVIYHHCMSYSGDQIVAKFNCFKLPVVWNTFADGTPNLRYTPIVMHRDVIFVLDTLNLNNLVS